MKIRRAEQGRQAPAAPPATTDTIRESLLVQRQTGTVSAVEYLRSNGVNSATIRCVLSGSLGMAEAGTP